MRGGKSRRFEVMSEEADPLGRSKTFEIGSYEAFADAVPSPPGPADHAKEYVMSCLPYLVREGIAEWDMLGNGEIELRFRTGETFLLGKDVVTRTA
jgi:hypothetical protein